MCSPQRHWFRARGDAFFAPVRRIVFLLLGALVACGAPASAPKPGGPPSHLWVANADAQTGLVEIGTSRRISQSPALDGPKAIAFDPSGNLWVEVTRTPFADTALATIFEYTAAQLDSATPTPQVTIADSSLTLTGGLAFDRGGNLWITSGDNCQIVEYRAGQFASPSLKLGTGCHPPVVGPLAIAFDAHGNLWIGDAGSSTVYEYPRGAAAPAPATVVALPPLAFPTAIAFDAAGNLWVTRNDSTVFDYTPAQLAAGGDPPPATTLVIHGAELVSLVFDASGNLWLADFSTSVIDELSTAQLTTSGVVTPTAIIPAGATTVNQPTGLTFSNTG